MPGHNESLVAYARATPLNAIAAFGLGPNAGASRRSPAARLHDLQTSANGLGAATESIGTTAQQLLSVALTFGGTLTADQVAAQTGGADHEVIATAMQRLTAAELIKTSSDGSLRLSHGLSRRYGSTMMSLSDQNAVNNEELAQIGRTLGIKIPTRKQERIDAIAVFLGSDEGAKQVREEMGAEACELLDVIVDAAGPGVITAEEIGVDTYSVRILRSMRYRGGPTHRFEEAEASALAQLHGRGIIGVSEWEGTIWLWREALNFLNRPLYQNWETAPPLTVQPVAAGAARLPPLVGVLDQALRHWAQTPPPVLKNGEPRLTKPAIRSTAKAIGADGAVVDLLARLAIDIHLLLPNVVSTSGRGRNRRVERVWLADPDLASVWATTPPADRWVRLVAAWTRPEDYAGQQQLLINRHLILWELAALEVGHGFANDDDAVADWIGDHYASIGHPDAAREVLVDLRALGLVQGEGAVALSAAGRAVLTDPAHLSDLLTGGNTAVIIQGDLTVLAPPDLDPEIHTRLSELATLESDGGAQVFRLEESRITRVVQAGVTAEDIKTFLHDISSVPLTDAVVRLVDDAADRADRVMLVSATTVVVTRDAADLALACATKAAKLTAVADNVAVSPLAREKVRAALSRRGLAPTLMAETSTTPQARTGADRAAELRAEAERSRQYAQRFAMPGMEKAASALEAQAVDLANPDSRLRVELPLAVTPEVLATLGVKKRRAGASQTPSEIPCSAPAGTDPGIAGDADTQSTILDND